MNSTIILGIAAIAFALLFRSQAHDLPAQARLLPGLLIWIVIGLSALMIIEALLKRRSGAAAAQEDGEPLAPVNWVVLACFAAGAAAYVALIPIAGYLLVTPLFIIGGLLMTKTMSAGRAVLAGTVTTGLVWAVFIGALNLPVPMLPSLS